MMTEQRIKFLNPETDQTATLKGVVVGGEFIAERLEFPTCILHANSTVHSRANGVHLRETLQAHGYTEPLKEQVEGGG